MIADDLEVWERICRRSGICLRYRNIPRPLWFHVPPAPILIFLPCWPVRLYRAWLLRGVLASIALESAGEGQLVCFLLGLLEDAA
jgi:hypothetical protein